jgi:hypothetical protein
LPFIFSIPFGASGYGSNSSLFLAFAPGTSRVRKIGQLPVIVCYVEFCGAPLPRRIENASDSWAGGKLIRAIAGDMDYFQRSKATLL